MIVFRKDKKKQVEIEVIKFQYQQGLINRFEFEKKMMLLNLKENNNNG